MNRSYTTIALLSLFILVGAGCGTPTTPEVTSTSTNQVILKAPSIVIARERAALYSPTRSERVCESAGNTVITRFDDVSKSSIQFCQFSNGTECALASFVSGLCTAETATVPQISNLHTDPIISVHCDDTDPPVCGVNGHTYANTCLAVQTGVDIAHEGKCTEAEIQAGTPPGASTEKKPSKITRVINRARNIITVEDDEPNVPPPATDDPEVATQGEHPAWVGTSISFIESNPPTNPRMYIEHCTQGGNSYYLETNGTGEVPSTAFTDGGNTICYPNRDFTASCPDYVIARGSCSRVYTDSR